MALEFPSLAVALGDPAGIGPEVVIKALAAPGLLDRCRVRLFGSRSLVEKTWRQLHNLGIAPLPDLDALAVEDLAGTQTEPGTLSARGGALSFDWLTAAVQATLAGRCDAVVTAPIAKSAWHLAGHHYPGQTEVVTELSGGSRSGMLFVARSPHTGWVLRVLLATTHIPLADVSRVLDARRIEDRLQLLYESLEKDFGLLDPRVAVAGLNPHSGEGGQIGTEEQDWLAPLLMNWHGRRVEGPVPPDTLWVAPARAWTHPGSQAHDAYLALYHDQGLIPVKMLAFDQAVNTTIGLPIVRTSPDHGTAFDIAGRGLARPASMIAALDLAIELVHRRCARRSA